MNVGRLWELNVKSMITTIVTERINVGRLWELNVKSMITRIV